MNIKFKLLLDQLEADRNAVTSKVRQFSEERMNTSLVPGKWSLTQLLTHILTTEELSLQYMKKKSLGVDKLPNSGTGEYLRVLLMKIFQRLPLRYRAPRAVVEHTPQGLSGAEIIQRWDHLISELKIFYATIEDKNIRKNIYKHAAFGRMDAAQALIAMQEHFHHHRPQIDRLIK